MGHRFAGGPGTEIIAAVQGTRVCRFSPCKSGPPGPCEAGPLDGILGDSFGPDRAKEAILGQMVLSVVQAFVPFLGLMHLYLLSPLLGHSLGQVGL